MRRIRTLPRSLRYTIAILLLLTGLGLVAGWWLVLRSLPELDGSAVVPGLKQDVTVDRDARGVPWIRAGSLTDLATAQGYVVAQDRLWQMDLLRRVAAGELSEILGQVALDLDRENRTLGLRLAADKAVARMDAETRLVTEAYARGVNRYIEERRGKLPIEFRLLGYEPRPWAPADTFLISGYMWKALTTSWKAKLNREKVTERVGPERAKDLFVVDSPLDHYIVGNIPPRPSKPIPAARPGKSTTDGAADEDLQTTEDLSSLPPPEWAEAHAFLEQFEDDASVVLGSNNFVVSGAHTASGKPLLANDTHLGLGIPCIWYMIHLTAPGWNVEGFTFPGTPLVIIGHNDRIAWGFTNNMADVQDLYVESFEPAGSIEYRVPQGRATAQVRQEIIHVKSRPDEILQVVVTRHGPIVRREGDRGYALRWTALEPEGMEFGYPLLGQAKNWTEFRDTMRHVPGPAQNAIYADADGNIGFIVAALIPVRKNGDGSLPVPGDTDDYEWIGYIPFDELPQTLNPPEGIIATANARTVGPGYKWFLTERWAGPYRTARIYELLDGRKDFRPADLNAIQNDIGSLPDRFLAGQLIRSSQTLPPKDPRARALIASLAGWDARAAVDSAETSFVEYTRHVLLRNLLQPFLGDRLNIYEWWDFTGQYDQAWLRDKVFLENILRDRPARWLPKAYSSYDELLMASADQAVEQLQRESGHSEISGWGWGERNTLRMFHPLGRTGLLRQLLSVGPISQSGSIDTVKAMGHTHGPAMRFVADLSNFDDSLLEITAGESGQYGSPHYLDQFPDWFAGRNVPMPFSEAAAEKARVHRLLLLPER